MHTNKSSRAIEARRRRPIIQRFFDFRIVYHRFYRAVAHHQLVRIKLKRYAPVLNVYQLPGGEGRATHILAAMPVYLEQPFPASGTHESRARARKRRPLL